ncbi:hypothetical protein DZF91_09140 [Actinomadura logoneensis]|uniref:Uncharacterized protein n=1 Tax=Actinomadura logoneensis TaxID=2293572 RepID=A0A372JPJ7_9ACTN|nr:hypothetical protein [Actinomadura logoneensis]RFU41937.1 hypothetical protein DZF91_09140 [Actinomadura logoneensis]
MTTMKTVMSERSSAPVARLAPFTAPDEPAVAVDDLFDGDLELIVQGPEIRNDYKKIAGSSDAAKTYDTTAT